MTNSNFRVPNSVIQSVLQNIPSNPVDNSVTEAMPAFWFNAPKRHIYLECSTKQCDENVAYAINVFDASRSKVFLGETEAVTKRARTLSA